MRCTVGMSGSARWLVLPRGPAKGSSIQCCCLLLLCWRRRMAMALNCAALWQQLCYCCDLQQHCSSHLLHTCMDCADTLYVD
jgi:hypothetical protein